MVKCVIVFHRGGERMAEKEGLLPFKLIEDESGEALTSYGGLPLVVETCEALGLAGLVQKMTTCENIGAQRRRGRARLANGFQLERCAGARAAPEPGARRVGRTSSERGRRYPVEGAGCLHEARDCISRRTQFRFGGVARVGRGLA